MADEGEIPSWASPLMETIVNKIDSRLGSFEERLDGWEGSLLRRMDTLEVHLDSTHSTPQNYHASYSGHALNNSTFVTLKIIHQLLSPPR